MHLRQTQIFGPVLMLGATDRTITSLNQTRALLKPGFLHRRQ